MSNLSTVPEQKRYGLIKPMGVVPQPAVPSRTPLPPARVSTRPSAALTRAFAADDEEDAFNDDDEEDVHNRGRGGEVSGNARREVNRVNREILARSAATAAAIERQTPGALIGGGGNEVDYMDYDGAYDSMKQQQAASQSGLASRLSGSGQVNGQKAVARYIANIKAMAAIREKEQDRLYERRMAKERAEEEAAMGAEAVDATPKFVTAAYRAKLAEAQKWEAADRAAQEQEERQAELQRKEGGGLTSFYSNLLTKNLAFGSADAATASVSVYTAGGASQAQLLGSTEGSRGGADKNTSPESADEKRKRSASPDASLPPSSLSSYSSVSAAIASSTSSVFATDGSASSGKARVSGSSGSSSSEARKEGVSITSSSSVSVSTGPLALASPSSSSTTMGAVGVAKEDAVSAARQRFLERKRAKIES